MSSDMPRALDVQAAKIQRFQNRQPPLNGDRSSLAARVSASGVPVCMLINRGFQRNDEATGSDRTARKFIGPERETRGIRSAAQDVVVNLGDERARVDDVRKRQIRIERQRFK